MLTTLTQICTLSYAGPVSPVSCTTQMEPRSLLVTSDRHQPSPLKLNASGKYHSVHSLAKTFRSSPNCSIEVYQSPCFPFKMSVVDNVTHHQTCVPKRFGSSFQAYRYQHSCGILYIPTGCHGLSLGAAYGPSDPKCSASISSLASRLVSDQ